MTMTMNNNISDIWEKQKLNNKEILIKEECCRIKNIACFLGTNTLTKAKIFIVELEPDIVIPSNYLKRFAGVEVQILPSYEKKELAIILMDNDLTDIFILFIEDIIKSIISATDSEEVVFIISRRIAYWRKLFGKITGGILTPEQMRGLYGELYFFKKLLENNIHPSIIINAWQAPQAENQDYYFPNDAIEIKTTKSNTPVISISNEFQLDINGFDHIFLSFYHLNEHPGDSNTLLELINRVRSILESKQELIDVFDKKIEDLGIGKEVEEEYNQISYNLISERYFEVKEGFPSIVPNMIQESLSKVSYHIDPVGCKDFEIEFDTILKTIN